MKKDTTQKNSTPKKANVKAPKAMKIKVKSGIVGGGTVALALHL